MKKLQEDFKAQFKDLLNMAIPEWIISQFDIEVESAIQSPVLNLLKWLLILKWSQCTHVKKLDITRWTNKKKCSKILKALSNCWAFSSSLLEYGGIWI